jgi:hypothetical protein
MRRIISVLAVAPVTAAIGVGHSDAGFRRF